MTIADGSRVEPGVLASTRHPRFVRVAHAIAAISVVTLVFSGIEILMVHPRLYWGDAGNDLTPALFELPISRNYKHGGWEPPTPFFDRASGPVSAGRTYDIFNQNGWGRSLHFLAAWWFVFTGVAYAALGMVRGHFRARVWPTASTPDYNALQRYAYSFVLFVAAPLMVATGLTMSPAVTSAAPVLLRVFGGYQSARTIHFFTFAALLVFAIGHVAMAARSGFRRQITSITVGD